MEDTQMHALRQDPPQEFAVRLKERLLREDEARPARREWPLMKMAASIVAVAAISALLTVPAVRASAASFLALFRVVNFIALEVDPNRFKALGAQNFDLKQLIGQHVQEIQDPGPATPVVSVAQAGSLAGMEVREPAWLPDGSRIIEMSVTREGLARVTADATRLNQVMDALGITDLRAPERLDGQVMTVRVPPVVMVRYQHGGEGGRTTRLFQARSPEVTMPTGVDIAALGEIGLRIAGLPGAEARQFARVIDWNSTMILPLPPNSSSFKQVNIAGNPGIAVQYEDSSDTTMILWSSGGRVFGLVSIQEMEQALAMANSVR